MLLITFSYLKEDISSLVAIAESSKDIWDYRVSDLIDNRYGFFLCEDDVIKGMCLYEKTIHTDTYTAIRLDMIQIARRYRGHKLSKYIVQELFNNPLRRFDAIRVDEYSDIGLVALKPLIMAFAKAYQVSVLDCQNKLVVPNNSIHLI